MLGKTLRREFVELRVQDREIGEALADVYERGAETQPKTAPKKNSALSRAEC